MRKTSIIILFLVLLNATHGFSQNTKSSLDEKYATYLQSNQNNESKVVIDYLVEQFKVLDKIEKKCVVWFRTMDDNEISAIETEGYKFLQNVENFEKNSAISESKIPLEKQKKYIDVNIQLRRNFEIFTKLLNNRYKRESLYLEFKNNNEICKDSIMKLL